jgi:hypothetical protein
VYPAPPKPDWSKAVGKSRHIDKPLDTDAHYLRTDSLLTILMIFIINTGMFDASPDGWAPSHRVFV